MTIRRSFAKKAPPRCNRHGDSCDNDSVAADNGQKRSIDAGDDDAAEDTAEDTNNADNSELRQLPAVRGRSSPGQSRG
jgi:hypothetical protein